MSRSGIVNVRMVITEEKILSNIDKVKKLINPNSKKQIIQLEEDAYFKDLIESIKTYLIEYPKKKNFPKEVYKAAYQLVEYTTSEFEENTRKIEELIRQRETNISLAAKLKKTLNMIVNKEENWKQALKEISNDFSEDIVDTLSLIGRAKSKKSQNCQDAMKLINARIANLESNLHIEIDMERIEDRSKALSYIGIEIADALKAIPEPQEIEKETQACEQEIVENEQYIEETRMEVKPSLWQRIKNSKIVRTINKIMRIRIVVQIPALPEGKEEKYKDAIAQGGANVSGGQKQRLSIARAIAKDPEIFVFDDSFSALDFKTDAKLREALAEKTENKTVIIVAQRISTILNADQIIVLEEGKVVGIGKHEQLMKENETYRQIALSQLSEKELSEYKENKDGKEE